VASQVRISSPTAFDEQHEFKESSKKGKKEMRKQKGFSLIELLIVVAIILIIAAIAIPNLLRARIAANESSAAASERTIATAEVGYSTSYPGVGYPASLAVLGPLDAGCTVGPTITNACIIDFALGSAGVTAKSGFLFTAVGANPVGGANQQYVSDAFPASLNTTGVKEFCGTEDNVVRFVSPGGNGVATLSARATCLAKQPIGQ
jgi:prepilin-type N-terminal cleavage/methylation domain-containing protein